MHRHAGTPILPQVTKMHQARITRYLIYQGGSVNLGPLSPSAIGNMLSRPKWFLISSSRYTKRLPGSLWFGAHPAQHLDGPDLCRFYPCVELYGLHKVELGVCLLAQPHVVGLLAVLIHHEPDGVEDAVVQDGYVGLARHAACHHQLVDITRNK